MTRGGVRQRFPLWSAPALQIGFLLLTSGCALTPDQLAWRTVCQHAPITAGHTYTHEEVVAMNQLHAWSRSVEEVNQRCR